jgi:hypothetical protein
MVFHWTGSRWVSADTGDATLRDIEVDDGVESSSEPAGPSSNTDDRPRFTASRSRRENG